MGEHAPKLRSDFGEIWRNCPVFLKSLTYVANSWKIKIPESQLAFIALRECQTSVLSRQLATSLSWHYSHKLLESFDDRSQLCKRLEDSFTFNRRVRHIKRSHHGVWDHIRGEYTTKCQAVSQNESHSRSTLELDFLFLSLWVSTAQEQTFSLLFVFTFKINVSL